MTPNEFRKLALSLPGAIESAHMDHPDFRIGGKVFASLGYPDDGWGMVKLVPEQQRVFIKENPGMFQPCAGVWGERGAMNVHLASARKSVVKSALRAAVENVTTKPKKAKA